MALKDSVLSVVIKVKDLGTAAIRKFRDEVEGTKSSAKKAGDELNDLDKSLDKVDQSGKDAQQELRRVDTALEEIDKSGGKAAAELKKIDKGLKQTSKSGKKASDQLKETSKDVGNVGRSGKKTGTSINKLTKRMIALAGAHFGIQALSRRIRELFSTGDQFERLAIQMEQVMESVAGGREATAWVKEFTQNTPLQLEQTTETFVRLKSFGIDPLNGSMQAIVDQAEKLGGGYERVRGISLALGQAWAKQKLQGEEILQLIERGVPVWDLLADVTGKNTKELQELSQAGALGRDVIGQLIDEMGKRSTGAAAQNMALLGGIISNLKDEWALFLNEVAQSGALDFAKDQLGGLLKEIGKLRETGELQVIAKRLSDGIVSIGKSLTAVGGFVGEHIGLMKQLGIAWAALKVRSLIGSITALGLAFTGNLIGGVASATTRFNVLNGVLKASLWYALADAVLTVGKGFLSLRQAQSELNQSTQNASAFQAEAVRRMAEFNAAAGTSFTTIEELNVAIKNGTLVWSEHANAFRTVAVAADLATQAERELSSVEAVAANRRDELNSATKNLLETYEDGERKGKTLAETIKAVGDAAKVQGRTGVEALSIALEDLVIRGKETREGLDRELVTYLNGLSDDQFDDFGQSIIDSMEQIDETAEAAGVRLRFLSEILDAQLRSAAQRAGVDIDKVLTGVDAKTSSAVESLTRLATTLTAAGTAGEDSDKIFKDGLLQTLKSLDTSEEVDAVIASLQELNEQGQITDAQLANGVGQVRRQWRDLQTTNENTSDSVGNTTTEIVDNLGRQEEASEKAVDAAGALAKAYNAIRDPVVALGPAAEELFNKLQGIDAGGVSGVADEFAELHSEIDKANTTIDQNRALVTASFTGLTAFLRQSSVNAAEVTKQYSQQKLEIEELQSSFAKGSISAAQFASRARAAASSTSLLSRTDLSTLNGSIEQAEQSMESLQNSTESTLNSLQRELAQIRGDTLQAETLNFQARITDLEARLEEAKKSGDAEAIANANAALSVAKKIFAVKKKQIIDETRAQKDREAEQDREEQQAKVAEQDNREDRKSDGKAAVTKTHSPPEVVIRLEGPISSVQVKTEDPQGFLDVLAESGRTTS
ncbi:tape measure protein [Porticoccaceae bacterium]|nr:tape measure protein [Porticoccaceae bacterium]